MVFDLIVMLVMRKQSILIQIVNNKRALMCNLSFQIHCVTLPKRKFYDLDPVNWKSKSDILP